MPIELLLAFAAASALLIATPGPTVLLVAGYAVSAGPRIAIASLLGVALGDGLAILVSFLGFGAILATSATLFTVLKWVGAAYLVWLGIQMWRAPTVLPGAIDAPPPPRVSKAIGQAFLVTFLNPKGIIFFAAFMPQFLDPAAPALPQMLLLGATFIGLALTIQAVYVLLLGKARARIVRPGVLRVMNRTGGTMLIGAGLLTATLRRGS